MSEDPMLGATLGDRFEILSLVGKGGMASVYRARDTVLDRVVAIKVFTVDTSEDRARLESEVRLLSGLNHPNLVTVHDAHLAVGPDDGPSFLVMEFVAGTTLSEAIARAAVPGDLIAAVASGIAEALRVVHSAGIVHRDVKPPNILIEHDAPTPTGVRAKLADFGIAHSVGSARLTAELTVIGTAGYLSPEQAEGATVTGASDIYSLGLVLLECFTRHMEYPGTAAESLAARLGREPALPGTLPTGWSSLLGRMLARDPGTRPTALEVARSAELISGELTGSLTASGTDSAELAKTRVLPVVPAGFPGHDTVATRLLTARTSESESPRGADFPSRRRSIIRVALIAFAALLVLAVVISLVRSLSPVTPSPRPVISSSTPPPAQTTPTANPNPTPPPGKGKGHGHGKNH